MTDKSKTDAPKAEELSAEDLDSVTGGFMKLGDIKGEKQIKGVQQKREVDKDGKTTDPNGDPWIIIQS